MDTLTLKNSLLSGINAVKVLAEASLKDDGLKKEDSQLLCILEGLQKAEMSVNGIEDADLKTDADEGEDDRNFDTIAGHEIRWYVADYQGDTITDLDDASIEHITAMLVDGYHTGELCISYYPDSNNVDADPVELRGWWEKD